MKIAQVAPLYESVPPKCYGGTERVVSYLTEALVKEGHEVTLFASGDSITKAKLAAACHRSLRLDKECIDPLSYHVVMMEKVYQRAAEFDIIHNHCDYFSFSLARRYATPMLTTLHGRLDIPELSLLYREFGDMPLVSVSHAQREPLLHANWIKTVYHGLPEDLYTYSEKGGDYLAFIGRICPEKRVDTAIEIAKQVGIPLKIAAKVDKVDKEYFTTAIEPLLHHPLVEYIGEIGEGEKDQFLGNAYALLFPIDWPEPFGLCMIEAMACGTPLIVRRRGSVSEIVEEGVTGFIVESISDAVKAVKKVSTIKRARCREAFEKHFTASRMTKDYLNIYQQLIEKKKVSAAKRFRNIPALEIAEFKGNSSRRFFTTEDTEITEEV